MQIYKLPVFLNMTMPSIWIEALHSATGFAEDWELNAWQA